MDEDMKMETLMKLATEVFGIPDPRTAEAVADGAPSEGSGADNEAEDNVADSEEEGDVNEGDVNEGETVPEANKEPQPSPPVDTPQPRQRIKIKGKADGARPDAPRPGLRPAQAPAPVVAKKGARLAKKQETDPLATKQEKSRGIRHSQKRKRKGRDSERGSGTTPKRGLPSPRPETS